MQRFLNIEKKLFLKTENLVEAFPEYNIRGWIKEAIEEFLNNYKIRIKESDITQFKAEHFRLGFSFQKEFWDRIDEAVVNLKNLKKCASRNFLVNRSLFWKIKEEEKNSQGDLSTKKIKLGGGLPREAGRKVKVHLNIPKSFVSKLSQKIETRKKKKWGYSMSDCLREAVQLVFLSSSGDFVFIKENTEETCSLNQEHRRIACYLDSSIIEKIDLFLKSQENRKLRISRNSWLLSTLISFLLS